jgi:hypothetical protein
MKYNIKNEPTLELFLILNKYLNILNYSTRSIKYYKDIIYFLIKRKFLQTEYMYYKKHIINLHSKSKYSINFIFISLKKEENIKFMFIRNIKFFIWFKGHLE